MRVCVRVHACVHACECAPFQFTQVGTLNECSSAPVTSKPKSRCRDPLGPRKHEDRNAAADTDSSPQQQWYLDTMALDAQRDFKGAHVKARNAIAASRAFIEVEGGDNDGALVECTTGASLHVARRWAIGYYFVELCGSPPESEWGGRKGTISVIMKALQIPSNSARLVRKVLSDLVALDDPAAYDPTASLAHGAQVKIDDDSRRRG